MSGKFTYSGENNNGWQFIVYRYLNGLVVVLNSRFIHANHSWNDCAFEPPDSGFCSKVSDLEGLSKFCNLHLYKFSGRLMLHLGTLLNERVL